MASGIGAISYGGPTGGYGGGGTGGYGGGPSISDAEAAANLALARSLTGPPIPATLEIPNTTMNTTDPVVAARLGGAAARAQALEDYQQAQEDAMAAALMGGVVGIEDSAPDYGSPVAPGIEDSAPDYGSPVPDFGNPDMDMISPSIPEKRIIPATTPDPTPGQGQMSGMGGAGSYDPKMARMLLGFRDPYAGHRYMAGGGQV
jgi:hypothetical protein